MQCTSIKVLMTREKNIFLFIFFFLLTTTVVLSCLIGQHGSLIVHSRFEANLTKLHICIKLVYNETIIYIL